MSEDKSLNIYVSAEYYNETGLNIANRSPYEYEVSATMLDDVVRVELVIKPVWVVTSDYDLGLDYIVFANEKAAHEFLSEDENVARIVESEVVSSYLELIDNKIIYVTERKETVYS